MCVDLHIHSTFSDGTNTPTELVHMATACRLRGMAVTDHDTVAGLSEALRAGRNQGMTVITGLEISAVQRDRSIHILGYGIDPDNNLLLEKLQKLQQGRRKRNARIMQRLRDLGIPVRDEALQALSSRGETGRPHIARLLMAEGVVNSIDQAFDLFLGDGKAAWCKRFCYSAGECISIIHQADGLAVFAHPGQFDPSMKELPKVIKELATLGLDGLEIYYPAHSALMRSTLLYLAEQYQLVATGGSDYHGDNRPGTGLAAADAAGCPPDTILDDLGRRLGRPDRHR